MLTIHTEVRMFYLEVDMLLSRILLEIFMGMIGSLRDGNMMGKVGCITIGRDIMMQT